MSAGGHVAIQDIERLSGVSRLEQWAGVGGTSLRLRTILDSGLVAAGAWAVIAPYTAQCEVRAISSYENRDLTVAALTYAHDPDTAVLIVNEPVVNVLWFAPDSDDATDALQAAADTELSVIYAPVGTYIFTALEIKESQSLVGDGPGKTILKTKAETVDDDETILGVYADGTAYFAVRNIELDGNASNQSAAIGNRDYCYHHGINCSTNGLTTTPPLHVVLDNVYAHDFVRNPFVMGRGVESVNASNVHAKNSKLDHLIYAEYSDTGNWANVICEGYWDRAAIVAEGQNFNNVSFLNVVANPDDPTYALGKYVQDRDGRGSQWSNIFAELDPTVCTNFAEVLAKGSTFTNVHIKQTAEDDTAWYAFYPNAGATGGLFINGLVIEAAGAGAKIMNTPNATHTLDGCVITGVEINYYSGVTAGTTSLFDFRSDISNLLVQGLRARSGCGKLVTFSTEDFTNITFRDCRIENNTTATPYASGGGATLTNILFENCVSDDDGSGTDLSSFKYERCKYGAKVSQNSGKSTQSANGSSTTFSIAHGLARTPGWVQVTPGSADANGVFHLTVSSTNVNVVYAAAPGAGTNNLILYWEARLTSP